MKILALAGGVGGAKLVDGFAQILPSESLTVIVNTGDDFEHCGLRISPDVDTVWYTLAGIANPETGWGRSGETWTAFENLTRLKGPGWFRLGDQDLATHLERTRRIQNGESLSRITNDFCRAWNVAVRVLPMSDEPAPTLVVTEEYGQLAFQEYFVRFRCEPKILAIDLSFARKANPAPGVIEAIEKADVVVICPSNPFVSVGPILAVRGVLDEIYKKRTVVAVSPIVGGKAIKGPAAKMFSELGVKPSCKAVVEQYRGFLTGIIIDRVDEEEANVIRHGGIEVLCEDTLMLDQQGRTRLAGIVLDFAQKLRRKDAVK